MIFIDADNLDYPRYEGDVALEPNRNWQQVSETPMPENDNPLIIVDEIKPKLLNGVYIQQWHLRNKTVEEIELENKPSKRLTELF